MIKDDVKSGVSLPETLKPKRTRTSATSNLRNIDLGIQEQDFTKPAEPLTGAFPRLKSHFANQGVQLYRTDWRDGPVTYFAIKNQRERHISTLSELSMVLWAWEKTHG